MVRLGKKFTGLKNNNDGASVETVVIIQYDSVRLYDFHGSFNSPAAEQHQSTGGLNMRCTCARLIICLRPYWVKLFRSLS